MKDLTDNCPMPYGMYKGKKMQDVPANYLLNFLWYGKLETDSMAGMSVNNKLLKKYIQENLEVLKKQLNENRRNN